MLFLACNSLFFCSKNRVENFNPYVLFQSNKPVLFCFHRRNLRGEWNISLSSVSASSQFQVGRFELPQDHVRLLFVTFLVNLKFTSKQNRCILKTIYIGQITSYLWSEDSLVISACWLVLEQILSTSFSHFVINKFIMESEFVRIYELEERRSKLLEWVLQHSVLDEQEPTISVF